MATPDPTNDGWTTKTYAIHMSALRAADSKFQTERDRRYSEVNIEREKALKIKEEADKVALDLARQIQTYKDEKANELREQINSERGLYATKGDLTTTTEKLHAELKPIADFATAQQGSVKGSDKTLNYLLMALIAVNIIIGIVGVLKR